MMCWADVDSVAALLLKIRPDKVQEVSVILMTVLHLALENELPSQRLNTCQQTLISKDIRTSRGITQCFFARIHTGIEHLGRMLTATLRFFAVPDGVCLVVLWDFLVRGERLRFISSRRSKFEIIDETFHVLSLLM